MAQMTLKEFEETIKADEALRQRYEEALRGARDVEDVLKAVAQLGFELSRSELEQAWADAQQLDNAELDAVAGGLGICPAAMNMVGNEWHS